MLLQPVAGGVTVLVVIAVFSPLAVFAVILRLVSRHISNKSLSLNDYFAIAALVFTTISSILTILAVLYGGVGYHLMALMMIDPGILTTLLQYSFTLTFTWTLSNVCVKLSILHLYTQLFRGKIFIIATYLTMGLSVVYLLNTSIQTLALCHPVAYNWDRTIPGGYCGDSQPSYLSSSALHTLTDILIVCLPMPVIWRLQMKTSKKISISIILGIGILLCAISIVKIYYILRLDYMDFSYSLVPDAACSLVEPCLGVVNCCLPIMQPIANKMVRSSLVTRIKSTFKSQTTASTAMPGSQEYAKNSRPNNKRFLRFHDGSSEISYDTQLPLTNLPHGEPHQVEKIDPSTIQVSQEWVVESKRKDVPGVSHHPW